jgi:FkbM family methyltransferase
MEILGEILKTLFKNWLNRGSSRSFGQFGEDSIVQRLLRERKGIYVDVGAYHPILYSNSYGLYRRGWSGLTIDPNKNLAPLFKIFRSRDRFICAGVAKESGTRTYYAFSDGAYNTLDKATALKLEANKHIRLRSALPLKMKSLATILKENSISAIDFLNIDCEGMDMEILASHDWNIRPRVIAVEGAFNPEHPNESPTYSFLIEKGYKMVGLAGLTMVFKLRNYSPAGGS